MIPLATAPRRLDAQRGALVAATPGAVDERTDVLIATTVQHTGAPKTSAKIQVVDEATATTATTTAIATTKATGEFTISVSPLASVAALVA